MILMKLNLPNKITIMRIILAIIILLILLVPWYDLGYEFPKYIVNNEIINLKYIIVGVIFIIASITDFVDGYIARSRNMVTDFGKVTDAIADKVLVNGLLIILAYEKMLPILIPVIIITRDVVVDSCKMLCGSKGQTVAASILGKAKTLCMMIGLTLVLFYNLPFSYLNIEIGNLIVLLATILSIVSGCQYCFKTKDILLKHDNKD